MNEVYLARPTLAIYQSNLLSQNLLFLFELSETSIKLAACDCVESATEVRFKQECFRVDQVTDYLGKDGGCGFYYS